jgi:hypothetical protein
LPDGVGRDFDHDVRRWPRLAIPSRVFAAPVDELSPTAHLVCSRDRPPATAVLRSAVAWYTDCGITTIERWLPMTPVLERRRRTARR